MNTKRPSRAAQGDGCSAISPAPASDGRSVRQSRARSVLPAVQRRPDLSRQTPGQLGPVTQTASPMTKSKWKKCRAHVLPALSDRKRRNAKTQKLRKWWPGIRRASPSRAERSASLVTPPGSCHRRHHASRNHAGRHRRRHESARPARAHRGKNVRLPIVNRVFPSSLTITFRCRWQSARPAALKPPSPPLLKVRPPTTQRLRDSQSPSRNQHLNIFAPDATSAISTVGRHKRRRPAACRLAARTGAPKIASGSKPRPARRCQTLHPSVGHSYRSHVPIEPYLSDRGTSR